MNPPEEGLPQEVGLDSPPKYEIFKEGQPIRWLGKLGEGITGDAYVAIFDAGRGGLHRLDGLGRWVDQSRVLRERMKTRLGNWVESPVTGQQDNPYVVVKIARPNVTAEGQLSRERAIFEDLNTIFSQKDKHRPVRLYGYGVTKNDWDKEVPYLVIELVPERFIKAGSLREYTEADVVNLAVGEYELNVEQKLDFGIDRTGLGQAVYQLLAGKPYRQNMPPQEFQESLANISNGMRSIVEKLLLKDPHQAYPVFGGREVTMRVYWDLLKHQRNFLRKEVQPGVYQRDPEKVRNKVQKLDQNIKDLTRRMQIIEGALVKGVALADADDEVKRIYANFIAGRTPQQMEDTLISFKNTQKAFAERKRILTIGTDQEYIQTIERVKRFHDQAQQNADNNRAWLEYYQQHNQLNTPEAQRAEFNLKTSMNNLRVFGAIITDKEAVNR